MNYFLSGGAKNGKSSLAQEIVCAQSGPRYYLATMIPHDDEDRLRIRRHLENRAGLGFQTVECGTDILSSLSRMEPDGAVLLDSVTALLSNEMFRADGTMDASAPARLEAELLEFSRRMRCCVFVSDYIYADGGQYDEWTECAGDWRGLTGRWRRRAKTPQSFAVRRHIGTKEAFPDESQAQKAPDGTHDGVGDVSGDPVPV